MPYRLKTILCIAGSDSSAGAGIQADIKTASHCGVYATTAITAVTAQSTSGVDGVMDIPPEMLRRQIEAAVADERPAAVKIGMTSTPANCEVIMEALQGCLAGLPVVVDPVMTSTSGGSLCDDNEKLIEIYRSGLLPLATVVTPNIDEARIIMGMPMQIENPAQQSEAASMIIENTGCRAVALKGGHMGGDSVYDAFVERLDDGTLSYSGQCSPRIDCPNLHGTGCTFSTLMACAIACGNTLCDAFTFASTKMSEIIKSSCSYSFGSHHNGPLALFSYKTFDNN